MSNRQNNVRLDSLTGLRFAAVFVVFGVHTTEYVPDSSLRAVLDIMFAQGAAGVSFFFLLSGFVMVWAHREGDGASAFYRRRFARIAPAYLVTFVMGLSLLLAIRDEPDWHTLVTSLPAALGLQAWFPDAAVYYGGNGVGWSLSVEAFFYLIFPLLILVLRRRVVFTFLIVIALVAAVATPGMLQPTHVDSVEYWAVKILPLQRLSEFVLGCALALVMRNGWRFPITLPLATALAVSAYLVAGQVPLWAQMSLVTLIPFLLLIGAAAQSDLDARRSFFQHPILVTLGDWSYAFYLVHQIVILVFVAASKYLELPLYGHVLVLVLTLPVSVAAAWFLYRFVEQPLERRLRGTSTRLTRASSFAPSTD